MRETRRRRKKEMENRDYFQNIIKHLKQFPLLLILLGQSLKHLGKVWKVLQINLKPGRLFLACVRSIRKF